MPIETLLGFVIAYSNSNLNKNSKSFTKSALNDKNRESSLPWRFSKPN